MAYQTFRVEITRDETVGAGGVGVEITAYIDRLPESDYYSRGMLTRAPRGVWNSRLLFAGDFDTLAPALAAIAERFPETRRIRCYEYSVDQEFPVEVAPLVKAEAGWRPGDPPRH
jgi:hypothetical protein